MSLAYLWLWIPSHSTRESHRHPLKDLVMFQLHLEEGCCGTFGGHFRVLSLVAAGLVHRRALQPVLYLTYQSLLAAGDFVFLGRTQKAQVSIS